MRDRLPFCLVLLLLWIVVPNLVVAQDGATEPIRHVVPEESSEDSHPGDSDAVIVPRGYLFHTGQLLAASEDEGEALMGKLETLCRSQGVDLSHVVRLNWYLGAGDEKLREKVESWVRKTWPEGKRPVTTTVRSALPQASALGLDAVFQGPKARAIDGAESGMLAALPPDRDILYLSGRAARSGTLGEASLATMEQLFAALAELGSSPADVVQVKAFLQPMSEGEQARSAIEEAFADTGETPPLVLVEWESRLPTEIELIAMAPNQTKAIEGVSYFTPAGDKASPVFSRVARVNGDAVIFTRGLSVGASEEAGESVREGFRELGALLERGGSDLRHLAKATYYVSDAGLSQALNTVRPEIYDPARPPAASKVGLSPESTDPKREGLLMDFIGVSKP